MDINVLKNVFSITNMNSGNKKFKVITIAGIKIKLSKKNRIKTRFTTLHYMLAVLKAYGIEDVVASPGTQNAHFNYLIQNDDDIRTFSVIDERSAAYVATGIAYESNKPVAITCTGATASRNYLSALTEAYYKNLPIIAITFFNYDNNNYNLGAQFVDRSISQTDIKEISVELPNINTRADKIRCLTLLNAAFSTAVYEKKPIHINCPGNLDFNLKTSTILPKDIWVSKIYKNNFNEVISEMENKKVAIFIGSHRIFSIKETEAISKFAEKFKIPVFCDHTSNYHGKNKFLISQYAHQSIEQKPDIVIDLGGVSGDYSASSVLHTAKFWRISEDNKFKNRFGYPLTKLFYCSERYFFETLTKENIATDQQKEFLNYIIKKIEDYKFPPLPFSNSYICAGLAKYLPKNSSLHCSILNSLRNMNFYNLDDSIDVNCNVGGFGIDGGISTLVGQSFVNSNKKIFGLVGDLAFFYDMNILGNNNIKNNLRIILINNYKGVEFRLNPRLEIPLGAESDQLIAAAGHNLGGAKGWAESNGFIYISASNKSDFDGLIKDFCQHEYDRPVLFEIFTQNDDEQIAVKLMRTFNRK